MYHGKRRNGQPSQQQQQQQVGNDYSGDSDYDDEMMGDDERFVTEEPMGEEEQQQQDEPVLTVGSHLRPDNFKEVQSVILHIELSASPEELAQGKVRSVWKPDVHLLKHMKQNMSMSNRGAMIDEHLAGDVRRCMPLALSILQHQNSFPYAMGITSDNMMNKSIHKHGAVLWRVAPSAAPLSKEVAVFEPTNVIDRNMYGKFRNCSLEDLDEDIKITLPARGKVGFGQVAVNSPAHDKLMEELDEGRWRNQKMSDAMLDDIYEPKRHAEMVQVPLVVAEELRETMKAPLQEMVDRCMNLEDLAFPFVRADGNRAFNSVNNLHGEIVSANANTDDDLSMIRLNKRETCNITAKFDFMLW